MWKTLCLLLLLTATCSAGPLSAHQKRKAPVTREEPVPAEVEMPEQTETEDESAPAEAASMGTLTLPSNATSIRSDITDNFSCVNKTYGYYADVENDCQIFHVCLPVTYADGRENTFRWSFICPEETIFSQESFTCMRREDMTIECEDSSRYYELNGNFGGPAEEESKPTPVESEEPEKEESEPEPETVESEPEVPAEPEVQTAKPMKPVKVQKPKPNRRKPQPQRKVPAAVTAAPEVEAVPEPISHVEVESKPMKPQRFTSRPHQERPQVKRPAIAAPPMRNELFNGIRKRPAIFNKPPTTVKTVEEVVENEPAVTEAVLQLSEPQPTLKLQTLFAEPEVIPVEVQEPEVQASEPAVTFVQPEPVVEEVVPSKVEIDTRIEDVKPIEAIEEIPAVIVESLDQSRPQEIEKAPEMQEEAKITEEAKPEEELKPEQEMKLEEELKSEEAAKPEVELKPQEIQAEEEPEVPAKVEQIIEAKPEEIKSDPAIIEASNSHEEPLVNLEALEAAKPADAPESMPATPEMEQHSPLVEEILDNTNDGEAQESLGGFKPVDPVMAAEAEQLITDFLNTLKKNEEKPETDLAESILPVNNPDVSIEEAKLPEPEIVDKNASVEEQLLEEAEDKKSHKTEMMQDSPIINIMQVQHMPMDYRIPVRVIPVEVQPVPAISEASEVAKESAPEVVSESSLEETKQSAPEEAKESVPEEVVDTAPEEVKEIPSVEIQESPMEEPKESSPEEVKESTPEEIKETAPETEVELVVAPEQTASHDDDAQESLVTAAYMPSIEDIVELVKERLDQTPKKDQMAPMELILTPGAAEPMSLVQSTSEQLEPESQATEEAASTAGQEEEVILPIYKRVSAAEPAMSKVQTLPVTVSKVDTEALPETESQPEVREPKMDARKRRFLFRADAS
ncbi:titin [Drosophila mauritiana]|uniref:Titin n=1 Tax=Drosophila mauritiana TaxID=7226 RepID=A0A6P8JV80_DROMA|nr:titin [Drosophila mauritiana]